MPAEQRIRILTPEQAVSDITTPSTAIGAVLSSTFARPRSQRVIVIGDSIDQTSDQGANFWGGSVWSWLSFWTKGRFNLLSNVAIGGNSTQSMRNRFVADVVNKSPGIVVIGGGRNDIGGGVPAATTKENFDWMVRTALAAKIVPVLHTVAPVENTAHRQGTLDLNTWMKAYAEAMGVECIDWWKYWANQTTGGWLVGYSDDGVHPNGTAVKAAVHALRVGGLPGIFTGTVELPLSSTDPTNLWSNALNTLDTNADGTPDGWFFNGSTDASVVTGVALGKMIRVTPGPAGELRVAYGPSTGAGAISPGDVLEIIGRIQASGAGKLTITTQNQDYQTLTTMVSGSIGDVPDGVFRSRYTVPATGVTSIMLVPTAQTTVGSWIQVGQMCLRNLTRLGLV